MKIKFLVVFFFLGSLNSANSQTIEILGEVKSSNNLENIHIINKTEQKFTITNSEGKFKISAKINDTLVVSSIQNKLISLVIDIEHVLSKRITITLEEQVNELDEVVVGKILTGDLLKDVKNIEGAPVTSQSLGIPSYQGRLLTQSERKVKEASDFNPTLGIGGRLPVADQDHAGHGRKGRAHRSSMTPDVAGPSTRPNFAPHNNPSQPDDDHPLPGGASSTQRERTACRQGSS